MDENKLRGLMEQAEGTQHQAKPPRIRWARSIWWLAGMAVVLWLWQEAFSGLSVETLPYSQFKSHLAGGHVTEVVVSDDVVEGKVALTPGEEPVAFRSVRVDDETLTAQLEAKGVEFVGKRPKFLTQMLFAWLLPIGVIVLLWTVFSRRMTGAAGQALSFGKSRATLVADSETGVTFEDVAGADEAKLELQEVVDFLKQPDRYEKLGAKIPKGVLLVGPPGTGKTLLARAVAGQAKVPFFSISGSDFVEMFAGVGAARVRDLFEQAAGRAPCIVFIDELDAIGRHRGVHMGVVNDEREQTLNQLLVELDGFEPNKGVILLAATNRPDVLDAALLRPGRFDRQVVLDAPDAEGRKAILEVHTRGKPLGEDVDLETIARSTPRFSGADLANAVNEAALLAARRDAEKIAQTDLEEAVEKVVAGPERKSRRLTEADKRRVAVHEVGHALVAHLSEHADPIHKVSIVPRGHAALGYTLQLPTDDQLMVTRSQLIDRLRSLLGGRAAEEVVLGEVSSGPQNDLEKATLVARQMVTMLGMSDKVGLAQVVHPEGGPFAGLTALQRDSSEATARVVDEEVRRLLDEAYADAKRLITARRATVDGIVDVLLDRETLDGEAFAALVERHGPARAPRVVS